jgi:hypothetical protein
MNTANTTMLEDITILIPTFHRRGYLRDCLKGIAENLPECAVEVASDDGLPSERGLLSEEIWRDSWYTMSYDVGLTAKRNILAHGTMTKYALMGSDDFDFSTPEVRKGIIEMALVLKHNPEVDVVVGKCSGRPYHGFLEYVPGEFIKEHDLDIFKTEPFSNGPIPVWKVDIGPNYFLAHARVLRDIPWDEKIRPIGGEHVDWFLDLKAAAKTVVYLPFANINEQPKDRSKEHPDYRTFRNRCWEGHAQMMWKRNIKKYYGFNEDVK